MVVYRYRVPNRLLNLLNRSIKPNIKEAFVITPDICKLKYIFLSKTIPKSVVVNDLFRTMILKGYRKPTVF